MDITTPESLLSLLEKSRLLDTEQLAQARDAAQEADGAKSLAKSLVRKKLLTRWQAGQLLAGRSAFFLGKYKLIDLLGSGGMGRVFLAEHTTMGRPVALKIISKELGRDPASLKQFLTEARAIAALDHPNIVHPYNVDSEGGRYYMVMEYVEGKDLQRMVEAEGPLEFERAAGYIRQAADGLAHAHGRKMIHCDIKPANLLVNKQDVVKILDMGMARLIGRSRGGASEKDDRLLGTVDYLAPEQAVESPDLDHRVDIYSLGCTFYFLLTGRPPFPDGTLHERILKHQNDEPRKIAELRPGTPKYLVQVCGKMMAKDPDRRFQSADEVSRVLSEWRPADKTLKRAVPLAESESANGGPLIQVEGGAASAVRKAGRGPGVLSRVAEAYAKRPRTFLCAGLGGLAALVVLGTLIFLFTRSGGGPEEKPDSQIAASETPPHQPPDKQESTDEKPAKPDEPGNDAQLPDLPDLGSLRDFDPEAALLKGTDEPGKSGQKQPPPAVGEPEKREPNEPEPEKPPPDTSEGQPGAEPPAAEATSPEEPASETPEHEKTEPENKAPEETQPEKTDPEKPQPEPPKPPDPLSELPEAVDIPELGASSGLGGQPGEVSTIGTIQSGPDVEWQLYLLGGGNALKRNRAFVLKQQEKDPAKASWLVQIETTTGSGEPALEDTAKIWRDGNALQFQWAADAPSTANYLRNCVLQARVEGKTKYVTLTTPKVVEPVSIDLERGIVNATLPVKWLPDASNLRVEITKVEGREGHVVDPPEPAEPKKPLGLRFPRKDRYGNTPDGVAFRLSFTPRPAAMLVKLQLFEPPAASFRSLKGNVEIRRNQLEIVRDKVQKELNPADPNQAPQGANKARLGAQLDEIDMNTWYIDFYDQVHEKAKIHFRVFTEIDGRQVVLATTGAPAGGP